MECPAPGEAALSDARFFDDQVAPILTRRCLGCHNHELDDGGISFENPETLARAVVPGRPDKSPLVRAIRHDGDVRMPPGNKLSSGEIAILTDWIARGAGWGSKLKEPK